MIQQLKSLGDNQLSSFETVTVSILGKEYQVNCPKDDSAALKKAVEYLNKKMNETKPFGGQCKVCLNPTAKREIKYCSKECYEKDN